MKKDVQKENKKSVAKTATHSKEESIVIEPQFFDSLDNGTFSDDILKEEAFRKDNEQLLAERYRELVRYQKDGEVIWGIVTGFDVVNGGNVIYVTWNNIEVVIPEELFFEKTYDFGNNYQRMTPAEKVKHRGLIATFYMDAKVCFTVLKVEKSIIESGTFAGRLTITCIGSRQKAMEIRRDIYFLHKNRKAKGPAPRELKEGNLTYAYVLTVNERNALVECSGVETRIPAAQLTNGFVSNCCEHVNPGDKIVVRVKRAIVNEDGSIHLSVSGRTYDVPVAITKIRVGSKYRGEVVKYNKEKKSFTVLLTNGVLCSCPERTVTGGRPINLGDGVMVHITNVYDTFVTGHPTKL